eukprot:m.77217 g.77217  ORF g.77217 m.77217 type:complete len:352 (-) comp9120_c0_seq1:3338-4393(-)
MEKRVEIKLMRVGDDGYIVRGTRLPPTHCLGEKHRLLAACPLSHKSDHRAKILRSVRIHGDWSSWHKLGDVRCWKGALTFVLGPTTHPAVGIFFLLFRCLGQAAGTSFIVHLENVPRFNRKVFSLGKALNGVVVRIAARVQRILVRLLIVIPSSRHRLHIHNFLIGLPTNVAATPLRGAEWGSQDGPWRPPHHPTVSPIGCHRRHTDARVIGIGTTGIGPTRYTVVGTDVVRRTGGPSVGNQKPPESFFVFGYSAVVNPFGFALLDHGETLHARILGLNVIMSTTAAAVGTRTRSSGPCPSWLHERSIGPHATQELDRPPGGAVIGHGNRRQKLNKFSKRFGSRTGRVRGR